MSDFQAIADRVAIEALRGEFSDAVMMRDYDRFTSLFTEDGVLRIPYINVELGSREEIRAGVERMQGLWDYFVQTAHLGTIQLEGDAAVGRAYVLEFGHMRDGRSELNYSLYHDRYRRTPDGVEVHRARLRGEIPRPNSPGGLGAPPRGRRPLTAWVRYPLSGGWPCAARAYRAGVSPRRGVKCRCRWLWSWKPDRTAASAGLTPCSSRCRAR